MIRFGLRLSLGSGREALLRVFVTAAAVALGVGLLLCALAGVNGLNAQAQRGAWLNTSSQTSPATVGTSTASPLWWLLSVDQYENQAIDRVDVAPTGPDAPVPPGIPHLPGPGQFYASPALSSLLRSVPANQLGDRFGGREVGTIGAAALPSPNSLVIVIGQTAQHLSRVPGAARVQGIQTSLSDCSDCQSGFGSGPVLQWTLVGGAIALLLPVLILIATASRLSAARREERFAAMRLVGATPHQISVISAVEAVVAAIAGVAAGFALFFLFRPLLYDVPFTGAPLSHGDLSLNGVDIGLVVIGVPIAAAVSARLALRRVQISPLGVSRRGSSPTPRITRLIPLLAGIAILAYFDVTGKPGGPGTQILELLVGFALIIVGLVQAGPWFTTAGSRLMARHGTAVPTLIAGRRLLDNPKSAFRFVSGLVIALFVTSAAIGALSSIGAFSASATSGDAGAATLADTFCSFSSTSCPPSTHVASVPQSTVDRLLATSGVRGVTVVHQPPATAARTSGPQAFGQAVQGPQPFGVVACDELARTPAIGKCPPGAAAVSVGYFLSNVLGHRANAASRVWPSAGLSAAEVARLPVNAVVVATDGSAGSIERARTALEQAFPYQGGAVAVDALDPSTARLLAMIEDMTDVIIVASLVIAACSLAVNIAGGLGERKRPFSLLRLTGVPTRVLHRVVGLESAMPLLVVAAVSIVVGMLSAALYLHSQVGIEFHLPGISYWLTIVAGLGASLAIIACTFPLLNRITGPEVARND